MELPHTQLGECFRHKTTTSVSEQNQVRRLLLCNHGKTFMWSYITYYSWVKSFSFSVIGMCSITYSETPLAAPADAFLTNIAANNAAGGVNACGVGFVEIDGNLYCDGVLTSANGGALAGIIQSKHTLLFISPC